MLAAQTQGMESTLVPLVCDLLEWIARAPRTHAEVMDGWRTSCPRLPVWEEATANGYVARRGVMVELTERGRAFVEWRHIEATGGDRAGVAAVPAAPRRSRPAGKERRPTARESTG
jgi:hypothetical protein